MCLFIRDIKTTMKQYYTFISTLMKDLYEIELIELCVSVYVSKYVICCKELVHNVMAAMTTNTMVPAFSQDGAGRDREVI